MAAGTALVSRRHYFEPWYLVYFVLGAAAAGIAPILLPLTIDVEGGASDVGLVMAVNGLGGLTAAVWGSLADRYGLHRVLCVGGALATATTFVGFAFLSGPAAWIVFAGVLGIGIAMAFTISNLFVVEASPKPE
jgi:MFS family permease